MLKPAGSQEIPSSDDFAVYDFDLELACMAGNH